MTVPLRAMLAFFTLAFALTVFVPRGKAD